MICQNSSNSGNYPHSPQCYRGIVENKVDVFYNDSNTDMDSLLLCKECSKSIKKQARRYGYRVFGYKVKSDLTPNQERRLR